MLSPFCSLTLKYYFVVVLYLQPSPRDSGKSGYFSTERRTNTALRGHFANSSSDRNDSL
jgi:hypothetical protein